MNISVSPKCEPGCGRHDGLCSFWSQWRIHYPAGAVDRGITTARSGQPQTAEIWQSSGDPIAGQAVGRDFTGLNSTNWTATGPSWLTPTPAAASRHTPRRMTVGIDTAAIGQAGKYTDTLTVVMGKPPNRRGTLPGRAWCANHPTLRPGRVTQDQNLLKRIPLARTTGLRMRGHVRSLRQAHRQGDRGWSAWQPLGTLDPSALATVRPTLSPTPMPTARL